MKKKELRKHLKRIANNQKVVEEYLEAARKMIKNGLESLAVSPVREPTKGVLDGIDGIDGLNPVLKHFLTRSKEQAEKDAENVEKCFDRVKTPFGDFMIRKQKTYELNIPELTEEELEKLWDEYSNSVIDVFPWESFRDGAKAYRKAIQEKLNKSEVEGNPV